MSASFLNEPVPDIGIDATVLASGHATRGIGRYVRGLLLALSAERPDWPSHRLGALIGRSQRSPTAVVWRTRRSPFRPQDLDWPLAVLADRLALGRRRPRGWHHTDPRVPWSPLAADRTLVEGIVRETTGSVPRELRFLRTDDGLLAYLTLGLDPATPLADAHARASEIEERIRRERPGITDVIVHTEP